MATNGFQENSIPRRAMSRVPIAKTYSNISACQSARQHNGDHYGDIHNTTRNVYNAIHYATTPALDSGDPKRSMREAAANGQIHEVQRLLLRPDCLNAADDTGMTPLHHACLSGFTDVVEALVEAGATLSAHSELYGSPLCLAVLKERTSCVDILLRARANLNAPGGKLGSPMHAACYTGNLDLVQTLANAGARLDEVRKVYWRALACLRNPSESNLSAHAAECQPIFAAAKQGHSEVVEYLLAKGVDQNVTARAWVDSQNFDDSFEKAAVNQRSSEQSLATYAAFADRHQVVQCLVEKDTNLKRPDSTSFVPLHYASRNGSLNTAGLLLRSGAAPEVTTLDGKRPIHVATEWNQPACISLLATSGASVTLGRSTPFQPLAMAASKGFTECCAALIDAGAALDYADERGYTALMNAVLQNHLGCVRLLLNKGAAPNPRNHSGWSALAMAADYGHFEALNMLIDGGADANMIFTERQSALTLAAAKGRADCVEALLKCDGVRPDHADGSNVDAVSHATIKGSAQAIRHLARAGADVNSPRVRLMASSDGTTSHEVTLLIHAAYSGNYNCVQALLDNGAKMETVCSQNKSALAHACERGHADVVRILVNFGASSHNDADAMPPLVLAAQFGKRGCISELVERYADLNICTKTGCTAAIAAARAGHLDCLQELADRGADLWRKDHNGRSPLMEAAQWNHLTCVQFILSRNRVSNDTSVDLVDLSGVTALFLAARNGFTECLRALILARASLDKADSRNFTPLMRAIQVDQHECVKLLIEAGADVTIVEPKTKQLALHFAAQQGNLETVRLLLSKVSNKDSVCSENRTPLSLAAYNGHLTVISELIKCGASVMPRTGAQLQLVTPPFVLAALCGRVGACRLLYDANRSLYNDSVFDEALSRAQKYSQLETYHFVGTLKELHQLRFPRTPVVIKSSVKPSGTPPRPFQAALARQMLPTETPSNQGTRQNSLQAALARNMS